jgi:hypothetical protein
MTLDLWTEWTAYHRDGAPQLYPEALRDEIDEVATAIQRVNAIAELTRTQWSAFRCARVASQRR